MLRHDGGVDGDTDVTCWHDNILSVAWLQLDYEI